MDINRFHGCDSIQPHHILMLGLGSTDEPGDLYIVYSGPLRNVPAEGMQYAVLSYVHPGTLAEIKTKADAALAAKLLKDDPEDSRYAPYSSLGEHWG